MGVGLYLHGHSDVAGWVETLRERLEEVRHPAAGEIDVGDEGVVSATTTPAGPGYHVAVCDALQRAARELKISWEPTGDDTGYFHSGNLKEVERHMLQWLKTLAHVAVEKEFGKGSAICMPLHHQYQADGVVTPLGPRDEKWFRMVAEDPTRGRDFFPWWTPGENAAALIGRARVLMWSEVRWRLPTCDLDEDTLDDVQRLLERAWELDSTADFPAREWCELVDHNGGEVPDEIQDRAAKESGPLIGYRRHPVRVTVGDWCVEIPGEFSEEWQDGTFSAWHEGRTVWFDGYRKNGAASELVEASPADGEVLTRKDGDVLKKAYLTRDDEGVFILSTRNAVDGKLAVSTIAFPSESDREWAMQAWQSWRPK